MSALLTVPTGRRKRKKNLLLLTTLPFPSSTQTYADITTDQLTFHLNMTTQPDALTDVRRLDLKMADPSPPIAVKRKADELEAEVAGVEYGEEEKHGGTEKKRMVKRRKKNKGRKKKKDNGSKGGNEDKKGTSEDVTTEVEEALGENTQAKGLEDEAVDSDKTGDSNTSGLKPKKEEKKRDKKKGNKGKKGQMRKQSDHEMPDNKLNGKKRDVKNSPDEESSEKDGKENKRKSTASPSLSPHPEKHHTTPLSSKTITTPKSLLKKSNNKTPTPRTKTVTFADDAKSTDGGSIANTVRFPVGIGGRGNIPRLPGSPQPHPALLAQQSSPSSSSTTTTTQQGALSPSLNPAEDYHNEQQNTKPQIAYLLNYYQARSSWKFSKTKQNWIIRNIWNLAEFGAEVLQSALWAYVNGLVAQGPKGRLLAEAKEVAKARREELGAVDAEDDPKYRRAKLVLTALGDDDIPSEDDADGMDVDSDESAYAEGGE